MLRKLAQVNDVNTVMYSFHFVLTNMVLTRVRGNLRMRKQNTKTSVPLDVVPDRRTERFPLRFRPVGHLCELRFGYPSSPTGREGQLSRPFRRYETDPIHPFGSIHKWYQFLYIYRYFLHVVRLGVYYCS